MIDFQDSMKRNETADYVMIDLIGKFIYDILPFALISSYYYLSIRFKHGGRHKRCGFLQTISCVLSGTLEKVFFLLSNFKS